jgi:hypothetical protein
MSAKHCKGIQLMKEMDLSEIRLSQMIESAEYLLLALRQVENYI